MADMYSINHSIREIILMLVYLLLLVQFGCIFAAAVEKGRYLLKYIFPAFTAVCMVLFWLQYINRRAQLSMGIPHKSSNVWLHKIPAGCFIILIFIFFIYTVFLFMKIRRHYQNTVTESSIKESIDNLPSGLSFSSPDGFILLANRRMESLCYAITGLDFQDAENFWKFLSESKPGDGVQRISDGKTPGFQLPDKTIWTFERKLLNVEGEKVIQITAIDTTKLHELSADLQRNNERLSEINSQLKEYGENIEALVRNREILETKSRIHNEMGQALLASRCYLVKDSSLISENDIIQHWKYVIELLKKKVATGNPERTWGYFIEAAGAAGVKIITDGELPENEKVIKLAVAAATEALTNAVRHAGADELYIRITVEEKTVRMVFTNNGKKPDREITEGGGLGSLRLRLEEAGGTLEIMSEPHLALIVTMPVVRRENADECIDCGR